LFILKNKRAQSHNLKAITQTRCSEIIVIFKQHQYTTLRLELQAMFYVPLLPRWMFLLCYSSLYQSSTRTTGVYVTWQAIFAIFILWQEVLFEVGLLLCWFWAS